MKKVVSFLAAAGIVMFFTVSAQAQLVGSVARPGEFKKVGGAGAQFLKIGVGAREAGMAGAAAAVSTGVTAVHWNPAGIADVRGISGVFANTQWIGDFTHNFIGIAMPVFEDYVAQISLINFSSGPIPITTVIDDEGTGATYDISDFAIGASLAGYLNENFAFGFTFKYISQNISSMHSSGIAFDVGTLYKLYQFNDLRFGFAISNLGPELQYRGGELLTTVDLAPGLRNRPSDAEIVTNPYPLPLYVRAGISLDALDKVEDHSLRIAGEFITFSDTPEQFIVGGEYSWKDLLYLRGGYLFGNDQLGLSAGAGIRYEGGEFIGALDYAFSMTESMGLIHWITLRFATF